MDSNFFMFVLSLFNADDNVICQLHADYWYIDSEGQFHCDVESDIDFDLNALEIAGMTITCDVDEVTEVTLEHENGILWV